MRAQDGAGLRPQRGPVVGQAGAVRRADLDQPRAGLGDHLGHPEAAADLDQLPARDDHLAAPAGQRRHGQQHRRGAVVDHQRRLGAGQLAQQPLDVVVARAALPAAQVQLEVRVARRRARDGRARLVGQRRAPEVGVHHHAGRVEHAPQRRPQPLARPRDEVHLVLRASQELGPALGQLGARHGRGEAVDGRKRAQAVAHAGIVERTRRGPAPAAGGPCV